MREITKGPRRSSENPFSMDKILAKELLVKSAVDPARPIIPEAASYRSLHEGRDGKPFAYAASDAESVHGPDAVFDDKGLPVRAGLLGLPEAYRNRKERERGQVIHGFGEVSLTNTVGNPSEPHIVHR